MKGLFWFVLLIAAVFLFSPQVVYSDANFYTDVKLELDDIGTVEFSNSVVLLLEVEVTNIGNEGFEVYDSYFMMLDKNKNQYSTLSYLDFPYGTISDNDCPYYQFEKINPNVSKEFNLCYEITKKEWLNYYIILYDLNPDYCGISSYLPCTNTKSLKITEVPLESSTGTGTTKDRQTNTQQGNSYQNFPSGQNWYNIYIDELPSWASFANNAVYDATEAWKDANPGMEFYVATTRQQAHFSIQWVKDFGGEQHSGYAFGRQFIEVGLGDSSCRGNWQPYSSNHVTEILKHEIGHIFGHDHSSDSDSIMYPIIQNVEYGLVEEEFTLAPNYAQFVGFCTSKENTSFNYLVETDDPTYGFDVYVVPSQNEFNQFIDGESFKYYSGSGCFAKNKISFNGVCDGVSIGSGVLIIIPETQTNPLTKITLKLEESPFTSGKLQKITSTPNIQVQPYDEIIPSPPKEAPVFTPEKEIVETYSLYENQKYGFSIEYPYNWNVDDSIMEIEPELDYHSGGISVVGFSSDPDWAGTILDIFFLNNHVSAMNYEGKEYLTELEKELKEFCESDPFAEFGEHCSDYSIIDSKIIEIDGKRAYQVIDDATITLPDNFNFRDIAITTDIPLGNNLMSISVISPSSEYPQFEKLIHHSINSVKIWDSEFNISNKEKVPDWIKNNAKWWSEGQIGDSDFTSGIQYMIKEDIMVIPDLPEDTQKMELKDEKRAMGLERDNIPEWVKNNAGWWADGLITEEDFLKGIEFLVQQGIIRVS